MNSKLSKLCLALGATTLSTATAVLATLFFPNSPPAKAEVDCTAIETLGSNFNPYILNTLNGALGGQIHRINRRKTLKIHGVNSVNFNDCSMVLELNVTLERKIRRDAHGTVAMTVNISSFEPIQRSFCYEGARLTSVDLSRTTIVGEAFYRWIANMVMPNSDCFTL